MKIKRLVTLSLMAVMSMCICTSCVKHAEVDGSESEDNAELTTEIVGAEVSVDGSHGSITLNIPETWNWETTNNGGKLQTGTIGSYGIILKPNETKQGQIEVFYTNAFDLIDMLLTDRPDTLFVVDELERSLHPKLTERFLKLFMEAHDGTRMQLVFTTHEDTIMDQILFRRDEIWFVERDADNASNIYSLDRFKERYDKKLSKAYLEGRYGAIPVFKQFSFRKGE